MAIEHVDSSELSHILLCAFRYSLGRQTYITGTCADWLKKYWHTMPEQWREQIHRDVNNAISIGHAGDSCDVESWRQVLNLPIKESK